MSEVTHLVGVLYHRGNGFGEAADADRAHGHSAELVSELFDVLFNFLKAGVKPAAV